MPAWESYLIAYVRHVSGLSNPYLQSLVLILVFALLARLLLLAFKLYLRFISHRTTSEVDDLLANYLAKPIFLLLLAEGFRLGILNLGLDGVLLKVTNSALAVLFLYILLKTVDASIEGWGKSFAQRTESKVDDILLPLFHKIGKMIFAVIAFLWAIHLWGINIGPYLAGVGISGVILGLALQDSLKNIFGGITLIIDKTYAIGDKIKLESGEIGTIHDIGLRSTKILTLDSEMIYVPNGYLANSRVLNFTRPDTSVRSKVEFSVAYGSKVQNAKKAVRQALAGFDEIALSPVPRVEFYEMGDFALKFRVYFWVKHWEKETVLRAQVNEAIYAALQKAKIAIPYPTQVVHVKK